MQYHNALQNRVFVTKANFYGGILLHGKHAVHFVAICYAFDMKLSPHWFPNSKAKLYTCMHKHVHIDIENILTLTFINRIVTTSLAPL